MTLKELDSMIAKLEGGKSSVKIGNIREIRKIIFGLIKTNPEVARLLFKELSK
jgi:hypothetical protein